MPDIELTLKGNSEPYIKATKDAMKATQELNNAVVNSYEKQKESVADIEQELKRLFVLQNKGFSSVKDIDDYNRKVAELKKRKEELIATEKEKVAVEKQETEANENVGKSSTKLTGILGKLSGVFTVITGAIALIVKSLSSTENGMKTLSSITSTAKGAWEGFLRTIASGEWMNLINNIKNTAAAERDLKLATIELNDLQASNVLKKSYLEMSLAQNKLLAAEAKTDTERKKYLLLAVADQKSLTDIIVTEAQKRVTVTENYFKGLTSYDKEYENQAIERIKKMAGNYEYWFGENSVAIQGVKAQLAELDKRGVLTKNEKELHKELRLTVLAYEDLVALQGDLTKPEAFNEYIKSLADVNNAISQGDMALKSLEKSLTSIEKALGKDAINERKKVTKEQMDWEAMISDYYIDLDEKYYAEKKKQREEDWQFGLMLGKWEFDANQKRAKEAWDKMIENEKKIKELEKYSQEQRKQNLQDFSDAAMSFVNTMEEIATKKAELAQRDREILDTRVSEAQSALEQEIELNRQGFASNVDLKRAEVAVLKEQRDKALADEEKALKKQHNIELAKLLAEKAGAIASVIVNTRIANAKAIAVSPLTFGLPWTAINNVTAALSIAAIVAAMATAATTKMEKGASGTDTGIITGKRHSEGGERFLDHVEVERGEAFGVLSREATGRYGKVFHEMVSSFNKNEMPEFIAPSVSNNVRVDNNGPNTRLDRVIREQEKMNQQLKQSQVFSVGKKIIRKSGNRIRIIG